uniref:Envelope glycoprotein n=1 Tax=Pseudonaja textilis TaxID=8673 RepID=A0A670YKV5_PSETE
MYPDNFPIFNASDQSNTGSICAGWQLKDPNMWFFFDKYATNVHPQNYQCATIGYFTLPVQIGTLPSTRQRRSSLGPTYNDEVIIDTQLSSGSIFGRALAGAVTGVLTLGSYPGIIAQENRRSILDLTCRLEKSINATTAIIRDLQHEIEDLNQDVLQQRFAIDYLLARQGGFCTLVGHCGFAVHFHSLNKTIEDELANLQSYIQNNIHAHYSPFEWLTNWLPDWSWLRQFFFYAIIIIIVLIATCCFIQCIPNLFALFHPASPSLNPLQL